MKFLLSVLALLCFISLFSVTKQEFFDKCCADYNVQPMDKFEKTKYDGIWYPYLINDYTESLNQDCMVWNFLPITRRNKFALVIETSLDNVTKKTKRIYSTMYFDKRGFGQYTYDVVYDNEVPEYVKVIATDYTSYAIEWSCVDIVGQGRCECFVYVMFRKRKPDQDKIDICVKIMNEHGIDTSSARLVNQDETLCRGVTGY